MSNGNVMLCLLVVSILMPQSEARMGLFNAKGKPVWECSSYLHRHGVINVSE